MRWYILRTLLLKEILRHVADRGGIVLGLLLIGAALLLSIFGKDEAKGTPLLGGVRQCFIDYKNMDPWIQHLKNHPPNRDMLVEFRHIHVPFDALLYDQSTAGIQISIDRGEVSAAPHVNIRLRHPGKDPSAMGSYLDWFWNETLSYHQGKGEPIEIESEDEKIVFPGNGAVLQVKPGKTDPAGRSGHKYFYCRPDRPIDLATLISKESANASRPPVEFEVKRLELEGRADERSALATGLVIFAIYFFSSFLLPALTCEEHEKGILLAQALSPASTLEILVAKFLFYPTFGIGLGAILAGIYSPAVLSRPIFWAALVIAAIGYLGIGLTIATLARTQRRASMGSMCYLLVVALLLFMTQRLGIPILHFFVLEYHIPRILHASLDGHVQFVHYVNLIVAGALAFLWAAAASILFRKRGWQ